MLKNLVAIAVAGCVMAGASATTVYQFQVTSMGCSGLSCRDWSSELNSLSISMTAPVGMLQVTTSGWPSYPTTQYQNSNISAVDFSALDIFVNMVDKRCESPWLCLMEASLQGGEYLQGSIRTNSQSSDIFMSTSGSDLWSGYLNSDVGPTTPGNRPIYSGVWRAVSEPGVLALLGAGLIGFAGIRQRGQRARARVALAWKPKQTNNAAVRAPEQTPLFGSLSSCPAPIPCRSWLARGAATWAAHACHRRRRLSPAPGSAPAPGLRPA